MRVHLEYGRTGLDVELPDRNVAHCLQYRPADPVPDPVAALHECLACPGGAPPLAELARGRRSACVAICDITRPVPNRVLLPPILETLEAAGIPRDQILVLVATGMHRPNLGEELVEIVGRDLAGRYRVENHHGQELGEHVFLGKTSRGTPVWIDARYVAADLKITTGLIEPHFMAGFSGGRKLICPGLAAFETIKHWHGPDFLEHPSARCGCLAGNPVHEESTAVARLAGCDFIVNVVIDAGRQVLHVVGGDLEAAFEEGVAFARRAVTATVPQPVDIVVTTSAGYPLDTTYYQSVKGMVGAMPIVKPGGTIILAASMGDGIGSPEFRGLYDTYPTLDAFMTALLSGRPRTSWGLSQFSSDENGTVPLAKVEVVAGRPLGKQNFVMDQWQLEEFAKARRHARIKVFTDGLSAETLRRLFVEPAASVEAAVADALQDHGAGATIAVIPKGPYVMAELG